MDKQNDNSNGESSEPLVGSSSHVVSKHKEAKETSKLAVASLYCLILAFFSFLLVCLPVIGGICAIGGFLLLFVSFIFGVIAFIVITLRRNVLKGYAYTILPIILGGCATYFEICIFIHAGERASCESCRSNLEKLGSAIIKYSNANSDYLPAADKWCDLLIKHDKSLSKDNFTCPRAKSKTCSYAFNKNLDGLRSKDLPPKVVLLFEADGDWNLSGEVEILQMRHWRRNFSFVLFPDGTIFGYNPNKDESTLCWKP